MSLKEEAKKALVPFGFEAIAYATVLAGTGNAKLAAGFIVPAYLITSSLRYVLRNATFELRNPESKTESFIAKTVYRPLDVIIEDVYNYFMKKMPI